MFKIKVEVKVQVKVEVEVEVENSSQVGGEDRLCLTQLLQLVLHSQPLNKIHQVMIYIMMKCVFVTKNDPFLLPS